MPDLVAVREPVPAFGGYVLDCWERRDGTPAAEVGRWLAGHPGPRAAKHRLTPDAVAEAVPDIGLGAAVAQWRDRLGWAFDVLPCDCGHRGWADFAADHFRVKGEKAPAVVALVDGLEGDPEIREAVWSDGPRTVLVTANDSLDVLADGCVVRGEGELVAVTVWHRRVEARPEPTADWDDPDLL